MPGGNLQPILCIIFFHETHLIKKYSAILTERGLAHQSGAEQWRWKEFFADFDWPLAVH